MTPARTLSLTLAAALAFAVSACGSDDDNATTPATSQTTETQDESTDETDDDDAEGGDDSDDATSAEEDDDSDDDDSGPGSLSVSSDGRGPMILRVDGSFDGDPESVEGKLISGPGGCLALEPQGQPELFIFAEDTEYAENPPRVTLDGEEIKVGQSITVQATAVQVADVDGIPERCSRGAADTAWVVDGS